MITGETDGFEGDSRGAGPLRCVWTAGRRGVARVESGEFCGWGGGDFGGAGGVGVGEEHAGGEFVAAVAGEWADYRRRDSAGRGGYRSNGRSAAPPRAWERRVDCFSGAVSGAASDNSNRGAGKRSFARAWGVK